jgi:hypothetical protein
MYVHRPPHTMESYSAIKKNELLSFAGKCTELEQHDKWNKPDTERQILHAFFHMWTLKIMIKEKWLFESRRGISRDVEWKGVKERG